MCILKKKIFLIIFPILTVSCVRDNYDNCGIYLEFIFDYNMEYADSFNPHVKNVDVFVFDKNNQLILHKYAESSELINNKQMLLTEDLTPGTYKIITIGGQSEQICLVTRPGEKPGLTTLQQIQLALQRTSDNIDFEFPHVWFGETVEINYEFNRAVWPVHLVRNTNKFNLILQGIDAVEIPQPEIPPYTFEIITPEAGIYGYNNEPLIKETISYHPYSLTMVNEPEYTSVGRLNTMRLFTDQEPDSYRLVIRQTENREIVWSSDLIQLLKNTKPPTRPDNTSLPMQEYLDRQGVWTIEFLYREVIEAGRKNFIGISISVNGWIISLSELEV